MAKSDHKLSCRLVWILFILMILLDWFFSFTIKNQPLIGISSWFVIFPILSFFYFTFALIASFLLFFKKKLGLMLAYCVVLFGVLSASISYIFVSKNYPFYEFFYPFLIIFNCALLIYMAHEHYYFCEE